MANPRWSLGALAVALFIIGLLIPVASAEVTISFTDEFFDSDYYTPSTGHSSYAPTWRYLKFDEIQNYYFVKSITVDINTPTDVQYSVTDSTKGYASTLCDYKIGGVKVGYGRVYYNVNAVNNHLLITAEFYDTSGFSNFAGSQMVEIVPADSLNGLTFLNYGEGAQVPSGKVTFYINIVSYLYGGIRGDYYTISEGSFRNDVTFTDTSAGIDVTLTRQFGATSYPSNANIYTDIRQYYSFLETTDVSLKTYELPVYIDLTTIYGKQFAYTYGEESSTVNPAVTVYVQSSQTGALLANAHLSILAATGGTETEVVNATLPGGTGTYTLQPTGGGLPNPDYYRAVATVPGYTQIIENHSFTLSGPHDVIIEMRPDSGGPADPERAYLEFYVRDLNANPIPAASIQCGGRILQTNSAGYAVFEVAKNASHPWIAKKSGYVTIEGTATVADGPRYVVNVVLGPGTVPTYTPTTGETPGATPTPDTRTNEQKGQSIIDMIADNAEALAALALLGTFLGLFKLMAKW